MSDSQLGCQVRTISLPSVKLIKIHATLCLEKYITGDTGNGLSSLLRGGEKLNIKR